VSGGQQQRVALARGLVKRPKLLLLDEPMSALDKQIRQRTQIELVNIVQEVGVTCIMVTHDQEEAMTMAHRLAVMTEGRIVQVGSPHEVYEFPTSRFTAEFIGSTNLFSGVIVEDQPDHIFIESTDLPARMYVSHGVSEPLGRGIAVSLRPERLAVSRTPVAQEFNWARGVLANAAYMGSYTLLHLRLDSGKVVIVNAPSVALDGMGIPAHGETLFVSWGADSAVVLAQ
jgi:putrescine transport system ATP-binding protein